MEWLPLSVSSDGEACAASADSEMGSMLLAMRGNCSFLDKWVFCISLFGIVISSILLIIHMTHYDRRARNASVAKASALIVVNNDTDLFQVITLTDHLL